MSTSKLNWLESPSFRAVLVVSVVLRVGLILYSEWHDAHSIVKYTDVDYRVFSGATHFLLNPDRDNKAQGPWGDVFSLGDPYKRETYRYTPILALFLAPNEWLHPSFGKYLFAVCDIINGVIIYNLLVSIVLPGVATSKLQLTNESPADVRLRQRRDAEGHARRATLLSALHLLNPMTFAISTRGSSESVLSTFVLLTLWCALNERWEAAAILLGLCTHWKIYPFVYGLGCLGVIGRKSIKGQPLYGDLYAFIQSIVNWRTIRFGLLSASTFFVLGIICYLIWGYPFLFESYLYHLHRLDHRHNFSPYWYFIYLTYPSIHDLPNPLPLSLWSRILRSPLASFVPQMTLSLGSGLLFGRRKEDLVFTWFVQTATFVLFNKVCTSQYFLWYLLFIPLLLPKLSMSARVAIIYLVVWAGTQALWLSEAYKLEFLGENVFFGLWIRSVVYLLGHGWVLSGIIGSYAR